MKIAASSTSNPFRPIQHTVYLPHDSEPLPSDHTKELMKAISIVAVKNIGAGGIAAGAWKLTTIPQATSQQELTKILINNNVSPAKAPVFESEIRQLLSIPLVRAVLIGVSGGGFVYIVVSKTKWSRKLKFWATIGGFIVSAALYLLLRYYGILV